MEISTLRAVEKTRFTDFFDNFVNTVLTKYD